MFCIKLKGKDKTFQFFFAEITKGKTDNNLTVILHNDYKKVSSLQMGKTPPMSVLDMKLNKSDGEASVMLELWRMQSTPSLPLLRGALWHGMVAPDSVLSVGQIELCTYAKLNCL